MEKQQTQVTFTADELKCAVARYGELTEVEREQAYASLLAVAEFGQTAAEHFQEACKLATKGKYPKDRMLDAVVVPSFLIGMLVGSKRSSYATFQDTGERRFPKVGEWYFCLQATQPNFHYCSMMVALGFKATDYGILRLVKS
jgi:hypothetical protein